MVVPLSSGQYTLVYNLFSLTIAAMFAAGLFFFGSRPQVAPRRQAVRRSAAGHADLSAGAGA